MGKGGDVRGSELMVPAVVCHPYLIHSQQFALLFFFKMLIIWQRLFLFYPPNSKTHFLQADPNSPSGTYFLSGN